jgi:membrane protease YdiL (CAAX protease family)
VLVFAVAWPLVTAYDGWSVLGWTAPIPGDLAAAFRYLLLQYVVRAVVIALLVATIPQLKLRTASNTVGLHNATQNQILLFVLAAGFVAPAVEETIFRGILLRGLMRRWSFTPAALLSSLLFGAFHSYEASSVKGGVALAVILAVFGYLQCLLVRRTNSLLPAALVHMLSNLLAILIIAGQINH